ncbi:MAG: tetratricopeptide repeat protein [Candidatus Zixiibacteriota bacterium]|nr:MAG: tetratricopeptide repeat protein [candidate division Zixibacteria bacterium]
MSAGHFLSIVFAFVIIFTVMAFLWSRAKGKKRKVSPELYIDALKALLAGEERTAFQQLRQVARDDPDNVDAYLRLGDLFRKNKRYDKALQIHRELTLRPSLTQEEKEEVLTSLAEDYSASGKHDKAISALEELLKASEKDEKVAFRLLSEYEETGDWEEAFQLRKKTSHRREDEANRILALYKVLWGRDRAEKGELHKARVAYKEALNYDEKCVPAYIYLGQAYHRDQRLKDAVQYWKKLLELAPDAGYLVFDELEKALFELGEYGEISEVYERILSHNPKDTFALFALARIYEKKGMAEAAIEKYKQIVDVDSTFLSARLSLAKLYQEEGRKDESTDLLDDLIEILPPAERVFTCQQCGHTTGQPLWRCPSCKSWNSFDI